MMKRAGFLQMNRRFAIDDQGVPWRVVELHFEGSRFAIRIKELYGAISDSNRFARVEVLGQHWQQILEGTIGMARKSASGRALNIETMNGGKFTIPLDALSAVLSGRIKFVYIAAIPATAGTRAGNRMISEYACQEAKLSSPVAG